HSLPEKAADDLTRKLHEAQRRKQSLPLKRRAFVGQQRAENDAVAVEHETGSPFGVFEIAEPRGGGVYRDPTAPGSRRGTGRRPTLKSTGGPGGMTLLGEFKFEGGAQSLT